MTPDDAKTKWCPFVQLQVSGNTSSDNRGGGSTGSTPPLNFNCLADGCMAWRWFGATDGYCGLAGQTLN